MAAQTFGTVLLWLIILAIAVVIAVYILRWLYRRSTKEMAFVRTGFLGEKVVVNGGAFVIPVLHEITPVNMNVMRIEVRREDGSALITKNRMRVDLIAEFFVRVGASRQLVAAAAQTLGRRTLQPEGIRELLEGKFAGAMRTVAAQMTLEEMHEKRGDYASRVREIGGELLAAQRAGARKRGDRRPRPDQPRIFRPVQRLRRRGPDPAHRVDREPPQDAQRDRAAHAGRHPQPEPRHPAARCWRSTARPNMRGSSRSARSRSAAPRSAPNWCASARVRDQEAEQAQLISREAVEKSRLAQERNITEERIKSEEDTQRREIARRRSLDEAEMKTREKTEREQIALELEIEKARIQRERAQSELEIQRKEALEIIELERQIALAEKALEVTKAEGEKRRAEIVANQETETARIAQERAIDEVRIERERQLEALQIAKRQAFEEAEIASAEEIERARIATERGIDEARLIKDRDLRHLGIDRDQKIEIAEIQKAIDIAKKIAGAFLGDRRVGGRARQGDPGRGAGLHSARARDRRAPQADRADRRAARGRARGACASPPRPMPR